MKSGFGLMVYGGLMVADQRRLPDDDRVAMLAHVTNALPTMFPFINPATQDKIREVIAKQVAAFPAGRLHDAIVAAQQAIPR
jgi:hypothetical protein